jgi:hypothetical protein
MHPKQFFSDSVTPTQWWVFSLGMDPEKVGYLMEAGRFLGQSRSELIEQRGEDPGRLTRAFRPAPGFEHIVA